MLKPRTRSGAAMTWVKRTVLRLGIEFRVVPEDAVLVERDAPFALQVRGNTPVLQAARVALHASDHFKQSVAVLSIGTSLGYDHFTHNS